MAGEGGKLLKRGVCGGAGSSPNDDFCLDGVMLYSGQQSARKDSVLDSVDAIEAAVLAELLRCWSILSPGWVFLFLEFKLRRSYKKKRPLIMPTISVDKAALFKELGREYVFG